jgi:hypothetical protein
LKKGKQDNEIATLTKQQNDMGRRMSSLATDINAKFNELTKYIKDKDENTNYRVRNFSISFKLHLLSIIN